MSRVERFIKQCPFCGTDVECRQGFQNITFFVCHGCGATTSFAKGTGDPQPFAQAHAVAKFNQRASRKAVGDE